MPELPEVETIKRDIESSLIDHKILDVWTDWGKMLKSDPETFKKAVVGKKFGSVGRRAKLLIFHVDSIPLVTHLKLSGRLLYRNQKDPIDKFTHVVLKLDKDKELRFADMRKFGWMRVLKDEGELDELLSEFGIEPFTPEFTLENFSRILKSRKTAIKPLLMDQSQIAGVGNIYADESLWCARIHPLRPANSLSEEEIKDLFSCIQDSLRSGIKDRGTSVDMYLDLFGQKGEHEKNLKIFRRDGSPCPRCGSEVKKIRVGGRGTHFCPSCQKR
ncbi:MAG TPA: bifunctional DNA-formamidopyrimidine glycosylase/DNA-(apurinic or apyrimidinic site) lyase [Candidatus Nanoarchaeia archaeon]